MDVTQTTFGTVTRNAGNTTVAADALTLFDWSTRGDNRWPCSTLGALTRLEVTFDSVGELVGVVCEEGAEISFAELDAWASECLIRAGYPNHPAIRTASKMMH